MMLMPAENNQQEIWQSQKYAVNLQANKQSKPKWRKPTETHQLRSIVPQRET